MAGKKYFMMLCLFGLFAAGCETTILRQDIPVSSNPLGARILADGRQAGQTPGTVSLERNRDHILTLLKDGYQQVDMPVTRQYLSNKVVMKAVQSGVHSGLFFKNTAMGMNSSMNSISDQEASGEAYILTPPSVAVALIPLQGQRSGQPVYPAAPAIPSPPQPSASADINTRDAVRAGVIAGGAIGISQSNPMQKTWETSSSRSNTASNSNTVTTGSTTTVMPSPNRMETRSSSSTHTVSSSTTSTRSSRTSVSVGIDPVGVLGIIDSLFSR